MFLFNQLKTKIQSKTPDNNDTIPGDYFYKKRLPIQTMKALANTQYSPNRRAS